eukprot:14227868-Heterocapsa_arctica.AAC.1
MPPPPGEDHTDVILRDGCLDVVLQVEDVARAPAHLGVLLLLAHHEVLIIEDLLVIVVEVVISEVINLRLACTMYR